MKTHNTFMGCKITHIVSHGWHLSRLNWKTGDKLKVHVLSPTQRVNRAVVSSGHLTTYKANGDVLEDRYPGKLSKWTEYPSHEFTVVANEPTTYWCFDSRGRNHGQLPDIECHTIDGEVAIPVGAQCLVLEGKVNDFTQDQSFISTGTVTGQGMILIISQRTT